MSGFFGTKFVICYGSPGNLLHLLCLNMEMCGKMKNKEHIFSTQQIYNIGKTKKYIKNNQQNYSKLPRCS